MISMDENEIGTITAEQFIKQKVTYLKQFDNEPNFDLILDCTKTLLSIEELKSIKSLLELKYKTLVLIVSTNEIDALPIEWNVVPSHEEAVDFISFERMQRDLGF